MPMSRKEAKNWMILDGWIATLLTGYVEEYQIIYIAHAISSKDIWDELKRVHDVSGGGSKGRLAPILGVHDVSGKEDWLLCFRDCLDTSKAMTTPLTGWHQP